jgi:hypothetical protein
MRPTIWSPFLFSPGRCCIACISCASKYIYIAQRDSFSHRNSQLAGGSSTNITEGKSVSRERPHSKICTRTTHVFPQTKLGETDLPEKRCGSDRCGSSMAICWSFNAKLQPPRIPAAGLVGRENAAGRHRPPERPRGPRFGIPTRPSLINRQEI